VYLKIVATLSDSDDLREDMERAFEMGADLVELRVDLIWDELPSADSLSSLISGFNDRVIITYRSRAHGGKGESQDVEWLRSVSKICGYVDVEYENSRIGIGNAIFSWHDPSGTPSYEELLSISEELLSLGGIAKIVTYARDEREAYRVLSLYKLEHRRRLVAFSMGKRGSFSRRLSAALGSPLIYSYLGKAAAEGQISLDEAVLLKELLS
jgi:3-dehydroquinate dehydratase-1